MFSIELEAQVRAGVSELPGQASKQALSLLQYSVVTSMQYCAEKGSPVDYSVVAAAAEQYSTVACARSSGSAESY